MDYTSFEKNIYQNFESNGLTPYLNDDVVLKFYRLTLQMLETNQVMNITALTTVEKIIPLHYADSVKAAEWIPQNAYVADIGCGGGFPILPLAIVRPDLNIVGIDSTTKKARYVSEVAEKLELSAIAIAGRAESSDIQNEYREVFDIVISRAVARLNILDELCIPFAKVGGKFIALKGAAGYEELKEAEEGIQKLGGKMNCIHEYDLHTYTEAEKRVAIIIEKVLKTKREFPRAFSAMKKKPL